MYWTDSVGGWADKSPRALTYRILVYWTDFVCGWADQSQRALTWSTLYWIWCTEKNIVSTFVLQQIKQNEKNTMMNVFSLMFFSACLLLTNVTYCTWTSVLSKKFSSAPSLSKYYELTLDCVLVNTTVVCNCLTTRGFMWCQIPVTKFMFWSYAIAG